MSEVKVVIQCHAQPASHSKQSTTQLVKSSLICSLSCEHGIFAHLWEKKLKDSAAYFNLIMSKVVLYLFPTPTLRYFVAVP